MVAGRCAAAVGLYNCSSIECTLQGPGTQLHPSTRRVFLAAPGRNLGSLAAPRGVPADPATDFDPVRAGVLFCWSSAWDRVFPKNDCSLRWSAFELLVSSSAVAVRPAAGAAAAVPLAAGETVTLLHPPPLPSLGIINRDEEGGVV